MSLLFDWYETPDSYDKPQEEKALYPRVCLRHRCSTDDLCREIESMTTAHRADILLVLSALSQVVGQRLSDGCQVHLNGLGYLNITLTTDEPVYHSTKYKKLKVRIGGVKFLPDMELKRALGSVDVERLEALHSKKLTDEDLDERLTTHFASWHFLTRRDLQSLCGLTRATANRIISQLRAEGKLLNRGSDRQPIYVPAPGYYGEPAMEEAPTEAEAE